MKKREKIGYLVFGLSVCLGSQCCEIQEKSEKITVNQTVNQEEQQGPVTLTKILKNIEELTTEDKTTLREILELRIRYILVILAENEAQTLSDPTAFANTLDVQQYDSVMLEIRTKIETLTTEVLSNAGNRLLATIDDLSSQESPTWNIKLINCFMDLRYDFTQKYFHLFLKKLIYFKEKNKITCADLVPAAKTNIVAAILANQLKDHLNMLRERPFYFYSPKKNDLELERTVPMELYENLTHYITNSDNGTTLEKELHETIDDASRSYKKILKVLNKRFLTFASSITKLKNAHNFFSLYKELLHVLAPNQQSDTILTDLVIQNSKKPEDLIAIKKSIFVLKNLCEMISKAKFEWGKSKSSEMEKIENYLNMLKKTAGFSALFNDNFLDASLNKKLFFDIDFQAKKTSEKQPYYIYINKVYLTYPLMKVFIRNLKNTAESMKKALEKKEIKKKKEAISIAAAELLTSEKKATSKKKSKSTITTKQGSVEQEIEEKVEVKTEEVKELKKAMHETCTHLKLKPKYFTLDNYNLFETGTNTPSGVKNGLVIVSSENKSDCTITTDAIDFGKLKKLNKQYNIKLDAFHKLPFKALENKNILGLCQQYDIDKTDSSLLDNICNMYQITIPTTIKTMLLLPCSIKITGAEADSAKISFNTLCKKITTEQSTDFRQPGLHEGAIVCLLEEDKIDKNKFHIYHLDFHVTENTKKFIGLKK